MSSSGHNERHTPFFISLIAGGAAGTTTDVALFPIDTLKTRLQSPNGFISAGGFRGIYNGIGAAAIGSAPGAALFFSVYEYMKEFLVNRQQIDPTLGHITAACVGEAAACLVRVPTEVLKQNMQTSSGDHSKSLRQTWNLILRQKDANAFGASVLGGLYRGYGITLMREVPFAFIQFPIYERMKLQWTKYQDKQVSPLQSAVCGSASGAFAAAWTTPLDVIKTRLMLGKDKSGVAYHSAIDVARRVIYQEGWRTLLSGIEPRVIWISIGGFVFFGAYEEARSIGLKVNGCNDHN
mmetsp:Transcript_30356/g.35346  ORF Transcript_30356/g.35346 Transcript_30356/m.35346 type:complete len:294 (+) Transcript_30356:45-926(+)